MNSALNLIGFVATLILFMWVCAYGAPILLGFIIGGAGGAAIAVGLVTLTIISIFRR